MKAGGQECPLQPAIPGRQVGLLRIKLIREELIEFIGALERLERAITDYNDDIEGSLVECADALADIKVVVEGSACALGLDLEPFFFEVMRSNYTKLVRDGENKLTCVKNAEGKIMKPASYEAPILLPIVEHQISNPLSP